MELYHPSRCTASLPSDLDKPYLVSERKMDGSRYVLYLGHCPYERNTKVPNTLLSRRPSVTDSKYVDRSQNVPHITDQDYGLDGTVLDGEIMADNFEDTNSIMNSGPAIAISKQRERGLVKYYAFDVIAYRGKDVRGLPLFQRRKILEKVIEVMANPNIVVVEQFKENHIEHFNKIVSENGEGIILKDLRQGYGSGWSKWKRSSDISCVITGKKAGNGKYSEQVGSVAVSVYKDGGLIEIGFASGFSDEIRSDMSKNWHKYEGMVVDIFAQEISKDLRLRHPTWHRLRNDVNPSDCTIEKTISDLKTKVKWKREK